jgi:ribonuclease Z
LVVSQVDTIFITHLHGDHCFGIGGMLISINKARKEQQQQQGIRPMLSLAPAQELPGCEQGPAGLRLVGPPQLGPLVAAMLTGAGVGRRLDLPVYVTELVEQDRWGRTQQ